MASTGKAKPQALSIPQIAIIHQKHPEVGKAIQTILEYINKNIQPRQGTKIAPR